MRDTIPSLTTEWRVGRKKIYGLSDPYGKTRVLVDCECYDMMEFTVPTVAFAEIIGGQRRAIQDVLPDTDKRYREVFITGMTPAEFDRAMGKRVKARAAYGCYAEPSQEEE